MVRLAIAQIRPTKGEYAVNLQKIGGVLAQLAKLEPRVEGRETRRKLNRPFR